MNKFDLIADPDSRPTRINALPELYYSQNLNATSEIFKGIVDNHLLEQIAYYYQDQSLSYAALIAETKKFAAAFQSIGMAAEDRVLIRMADSPQLVITLLAIIGIGAIAVPTFTQFKSEELDYRANDSGSRFIVVDFDLLEDVEKILGEQTPLEHVIISSNYHGAEHHSMDSLLEKTFPLENWEDTNCDDICMLLYTSGTSGVPKCAAQCHRDLMAVGDTVGRYMFKISDKDIFIGPVPLPFAIGTVFFIFCSLRFGAAVVLLPEKTAEAFVRVCNEFNPTILLGVPTFYYRVLECLQQGSNINLESVRALLCAGEPLNPELERAWKEKTGVPFSQLIGTTEMFTAFIGFQPEIDEVLSETLGRPCAGYEITVRDPETFEEVETGQHGLMCVRGPSATVYWSPLEAQSGAVRDGWTVVQDIIWKDEKGFVHFVSRHDEMIITSGFNVAPFDVERILATHPAVSECACVGAPDSSGERSEIVKAFIILADGYPPGDTLAIEIQEFFKNNGPPYMYPREIQFVPTLPRSLAGKVLRSSLKKEEIKNRIVAT